jgi:hypothetical protein
MQRLDKHPAIRASNNTTNVYSPLLGKGPVNISSQHTITLNNKTSITRQPSCKHSLSTIHQKRCFLCGPCGVHIRKACSRADQTRETIERGGVCFYQTGDWIGELSHRRSKFSQENGHITAHSSSVEVEEELEVGLWRLSVWFQDLMCAIVQWYQESVCSND